MVLHVIRALFVLAVLAIATSYAVTPGLWDFPKLDPATGEEMGMSALTKVTMVMVIPVILAVAVILLDMGSPRKSLSGVSGLFFGVVAGVFLAYVLGMVVDLAASVFIPGQIESPRSTASGPQAPPSRLASNRSAGRSATGPTTAPSAEAPDQIVSVLRAQLRTLHLQLAEMNRRSLAAWSQPSPSDRSPLVGMIKLLIGAFTIYLCVSFVMQTRDDFRFIIPYVEFARQTKGTRPLLLDTSVIIDGRIADVVDTRILEGPIIIPRFILEETQAIADSSSKLKRDRGRRGLDMLNRLRASDKIEVRLTDTHIPAVERISEVDDKLVALAEHLNGRIVTTDYNLNKVAQIRGVEVINVNDLANALKPVVLPGEAVTVKIIKAGEDAGQGIGYLQDGTMVVVEQARGEIGKSLAVEITSTLQTSAGKMLFGRPKGQPGTSSNSTRPNRNNRA